MLCGAGLVAVGEYATWCGKVNVHTTDEATWQADAECDDGCNSNTVEYCQQVWPEATMQVKRTEPTPEHKTFYDAGCEVSHSHAGFDQYICCAPAP